MADDLDAVETWLGGLLQAAGPGRGRLAAEMARALRARNAQRIAAQVDPDGQPFAPRKPKRVRRTRKGRIRQRLARRKMFVKARQASHLTAKATAEEIAVGFASATTARIMRVHQFGGTDRVVRDEAHPVACYPARRLLGFPEADRDMLLDMALAHLGEAL